MRVCGWSDWGFFCDLPRFFSSSRKVGAIMRSIFELKRRAGCVWKWFESVFVRLRNQITITCQELDVAPLPRVLISLQFPFHFPPSSSSVYIAWHLKAKVNLCLVRKFHFLLHLKTRFFLLRWLIRQSTLTHKIELSIATWKFVGNCLRVAGLWLIRPSQRKLVLNLSWLTKLSARCTCATLNFYFVCCKLLFSSTQLFIRSMLRREKYEHDLLDHPWHWTLCASFFSSISRLHRERASISSNFLHCKVVISNLVYFKLMQIHFKHP